MLASPSSYLPATPRFLIGVCTALAICFSMQALLYYHFDSGTGKGESNYFSTMSRFQAAFSPPAEIAFAGSSITGRIPGREAGNHTIANLGSDGGSPMDAIRLLVNESVAQPKWLVIEMNTIFGGLGQSSNAIEKGVQSPWFTVGSKFRLVGATARPSSMLYALLLRREKMLNGKPFSLSSSICQKTPLADYELLSEKERGRLDEYLKSLMYLQNKGVKIVLVIYPSREFTINEKERINQAVELLMAHLGCIYIDAAQQIPKDQIQFTDTVHLTPESAARFLASIETYCNASH